MASMAGFVPRRGLWQVGGTWGKPRAVIQRLKHREVDHEKRVSHAN